MLKHHGHLSTAKIQQFCFIHSGYISTVYHYLSAVGSIKRNRQRMSVDFRCRKAHDDKYFSRVTVKDTPDRAITAPLARALAQADGLFISNDSSAEPNTLNRLLALIIDTSCNLIHLSQSLFHPGCYIFRYPLFPNLGILFKEPDSSCFRIPTGIIHVS